MSPQTMDAAIQDALLDSLHTLSQPLTALSFALALMSYKLDLTERTELLRSAQVECERAMSHVAQLRALVGDRTETEETASVLNNFPATAYRRNVRTEVA